MTASVACNPQQETGFRLDELASAFDRVRNPRDWKAPVRAEIPASARAVTEQAILWFTDTLPEFEASPEHPGRLTVTARGYRMGPAEEAAPGQAETAPRTLQLVS